VHAVKHHPPVRPGLEGEKTCRFTQTVSDDRRRLYTEVLQQVCHDTAVNHLPEYHVKGI